jgi:hypothetical protein
MWQTTNSVFSHVVLGLCHVTRPSFLFTLFYTKKKSLFLRLALANHSSNPLSPTRRRARPPAGRRVLPLLPPRLPGPPVPPNLSARRIPARRPVAGGLSLLAPSSQPPSPVASSPARAGAGPGSSGDGDTVGLRSISSSAFSFLVIESPTLLCFARIDRIPLFY